MRFISSLLMLLTATSATTVAQTASALDAWLVSAGYDELQFKLGDAIPRGAGVSIGLYEAPEGTMAQVNAGQGRYAPNPLIPEFTDYDPLGQFMQFVDGSGFFANGISEHSTNIGAFIFGNARSMAPAANLATVYDVNRWLGDQLHYTGGPPPASQPFKVQNHSWIGNTNATQDLAILRRFDYMVDMEDATAVVGLNNNAAIPNLTQAHPNLLVHSYNAIAVGRTDSSHSRGMTNSIYGPGRYRPDLVTALGTTSASTGFVSGGATLLRGVVAGTNADQSEPIKAMLLAGATKTEFANFIEPSTGIANPWNRTAARPLDDVFGAGEMNIYNSYLMTVGGQHTASTTPPASPAASHGWDYQDRKNDSAVGDLFYNLVVPQGSHAAELSIILAWNVNVTDTDPSEGNFAPTHTLQNLDLRLYNSTATFMGSVVDQSISTIDNVEHIYQTNLAPGTYTLRVSGAAGWDYGLGWRMSTLFDAVDADFDDDGFATGSDFVAWQRNLGILVGASNAQGDADGDGDVDAQDLTLLRTALANPIAPPPMFAHAISAIPEPTTLASAAVAALAGMAAARRLRHRSGRSSV